MRFLIVIAMSAPLIGLSSISIADEPEIILKQEVFSISIINEPALQSVAVFGGTSRTQAIIVAEPPSNYLAKIYQNRYSILEPAHRVRVNGLPKEILVFAPWPLSAVERSMVVQNCIIPSISLTPYFVSPKTDMRDLGIINFRSELITSGAEQGSFLEFKLSERLAVGIHTLTFCQDFESPLSTIVISKFRVERGEFVNAIFEWVNANKRLYGIGSLLLAVLAGYCLTKMEWIVRPVKDLIGRFLAN